MLNRVSKRRNTAAAVPLPPPPITTTNDDQNTAEMNKNQRFARQYFLEGDVDLVPVFTQSDKKSVAGICAPNLSKDCSRCLP